MQSLKEGRVYAQGSVHELMRLTGWGDKSVLYFGDNSEFVACCVALGPLCALTSCRG